MSSRRRSIAAVTVLVVGLLVPLSGSSSAADNTPPKISKATMRDVDGDSRADLLVLTYSEKIKHARDSDGNYPFSISGYTVKKVKRANNTTSLKIVLKELTAPDLSAKPPVTYKKTTKKPVLDMAGNQAKNQTFSNTLSLDLDEDGIANTVDDCDDAAEDFDGFQDTDGCPEPDNDGDGLNDDVDDCDNAAEDMDGFQDTDGCPELDNDGDGFNDDVDDCDNAAEDVDGHLDGDGCPEPDNDGDGVLDGDDPEPNNACVPNPGVDCDPDGDGFSAAGGDCAPQDNTIYPGAADAPDLQFTDSDCDGIDGKTTSAIFVSTTGNDADPGTKVAPKLTVAAALTAASDADPDKDVYAAAGQYNEMVNLVTGIDIYGAYDATDWSRSATNETTIQGSPQGALADGDTGVLLQWLTIRGQAPAGLGQSAYGLRAIAGSDVTLQKTKVRGGNATVGDAGPTQGNPGSGGAGFGGGSGGYGGNGAAGGPGGFGIGPSPGSQGSPGPYNSNGGTGGTGGPGGNGSAGSAGPLVLTGAGALWSTTPGTGGTGGAGSPGSGGGGGGGGGGYIYNYQYECNCGTWGCDTCYGQTYYSGGYGGNGGNGGGPGTGGSGGKAGGSSFGVYLHNSTLTVLECDIASGNGGNGGPGRLGGFGGSPTNGFGGQSTSQGDGAPGGPGGLGGAGGSSIAVFLAGTSTFAPDGPTVLGTGTPGNGGPGGGSSGNNGATGTTGTAMNKYPPPPPP